MAVEHVRRGIERFGCEYAPCPRPSLLGLARRPFVKPLLGIQVQKMEACMNPCMLHAAQQLPQFGSHLVSVMRSRHEVFAGHGGLHPSRVRCGSCSDLPFLDHASGTTCGRLPLFQGGSDWMGWSMRILHPPLHRRMAPHGISGFGSGGVGATPDLFALILGFGPIYSAYELANSRIRERVWSDKDAHCYVSCKMAWWWGGVTAFTIGLFKELKDELRQRDGGGGHGFDPGDLLADKRGISCGASWTQSCAECCGIKD